MTEKSIVLENLITQEGYSPYCGAAIPIRKLVNGCTMPRTKFNGEQFVCPDCGWVSKIDPEFIKRYKEKWDIM